MRQYPITKEEIIFSLEKNIQILNDFILQIDAKLFFESKNNKWSIAQNLDHLSISNNITAISLAMPKLVLKQLFKTNERFNFNYQEVVFKYQTELDTGAKATLPFQPKLAFISNQKLTNFIWKNSCNNLLNKIQKLEENEMDLYLIPHPIIGKITLRELLFFTDYHIKHHTISMQNLYGL